MIAHWFGRLVRESKRPAPSEDNPLLEFKMDAIAKHAGYPGLSESTGASQFLEDLLANLLREMHRLRAIGALSDDWFLDGGWNRLSRLHSRVWGALTRAVPEAYIANIECRLATSF